MKSFGLSREAAHVREQRIGVKGSVKTLYVYCV